MKKRITIFPYAACAVILFVLLPAVGAAGMYGAVRPDFTSEDDLSSVVLFEPTSAALYLPGYAGGDAIFTSTVIDAPFKFNAVGITFSAEIEDPDLIEIYARTSDGVTGWGKWMYLPPGEGILRNLEGSGTCNVKIATPLLFRDTADGAAIQFRLTIPGAGGTEVVITRLEVIFIDSTDGPSEKDILERRRAIETDESGDRSVEEPVEPEVTLDGYPRPDYVTRDQWGADPPQGTLYYYTVTHNGLHHTASVADWGSSGFSECAARVRAIQDYHMGLGWTDIGYNYLICKHGLSWEGRAGGDDVVGAHDACNWGSMGVSCMGYFHPPYNHQPTTAMLNELDDMFAWKCDNWDIDPFGTGWYYGYGGYMDNIYGHRDVGATACPGDILYVLIPWMRSEVESLIGGGGGQEAILDTDLAIKRGSWITGTMAQDKYGPDYLWTDTQPGGDRAAGWRFGVPENGTYALYAWWSQGSNRTTQAMFGVKHRGDITYITKNQQQDGGRWNSLGSYYFLKGSSVLAGVLNDAPSGSVVICDALKVVKQ